MEHLLHPWHWAEILLALPWLYPALLLIKSRLSHSEKDSDDKD